MWGEPGCRPPAGELVGVQPKRVADGGGDRPRGAGLPGTEPSSDGVSMSSRRDASGASPAAGFGGLREQGGLRGDGQRRGYAKHGRAGAGIFPVPGGCWGRRCSASVPASPVPLAGWLGSPGRALSQPLVPEFMGTTCLPRFPLLPVGRSSGCPRTLCLRPRGKQGAPSQL